MKEEPGNGRISVSRDALRAELAEHELRIREYINQAVVAVVEEMQNDDQRRWVEDIVYTVLEKHERRGWTRRERALGLLNILMTLAMIVFNVRGGGL